MSDCEHFLFDAVIKHLTCKSFCFIDVIFYFIASQKKVLPQFTGNREYLFGTHINGTLNNTTQPFDLVVFKTESQGLEAFYKLSPNKRSRGHIAYLINNSKLT